MLRYRNRTGSEISRRSWTALLRRDGYQSVARTEVGDQLVVTTWVGVYDDDEDDDAFTFVTGIYERSLCRTRAATDWWTPAGALVLSASEGDALSAHEQALVTVA